MMPTDYAGSSACMNAEDLHCTRRRLWIDWSGCSVVWSGLRNEVRSPSGNVETMTAPVRHGVEYGVPGSALLQ